MVIKLILVIKMGQVGPSWAIKSNPLKAHIKFKEPLSIPAHIYFGSA